MSDKLSPNFLNELAKLCLNSKDVTDLVRPHLNYSFIKTTEYKEVFKYIFDYTAANNKTPTVGVISQNLPQSPELTHIIAQIRETVIGDKKDEVLKQFERFVKKSRFIKLHLDVKKDFDEQQHDKAMLTMEKESAAINSFSLINKLHSRVFADFEKRQTERKQQDFSIKRTPIGIPPFDHHTHGGIESSRSMLVIARKGVGKSTFLRSVGFNLAFRGQTGVHFQAEGAKKEVQDAYDAMWTGVAIDDIKRGELAGKDLSKIDQARKAFLAQCGEIIIIAYEQFASATIAECRAHIQELKKEYNIQWAIFDYLEKFDPGDGKRYGTNAEGDRAKKLAVAEKIVNISTEFDMFCATGTQANDITPKEYNDPNFVITRSNISNLRATLDPFAYTLTLNQTDDESDKNIIRIHEESFRFSQIKSWESTYPIVQDRERGRFIDVAQTNLKFWDPIKKVVIKNAPKAQ